MVLRILILLFAFTVNAEELKTITPEEFLTAHPSPERKAIVDFIVHQFDGKKVSQAELDKLWNDVKARIDLRLTRFQIINQQVYADSFNVANIYFQPLLNYFKELLNHYKIPDVDFIIYARDEIPIGNDFEKRSMAVPAFMMSKNINSIYEKDKLLLPDAFIINKSKWNPLITKIEEANINSKWEQKVNQLFWRGGPHGSESKYPYNITNFDKLARLKLVVLSKLYPDLINAEFVSDGEFSDDQDGEHLKTILSILFGNELNRVNEVDHLKYKYLITIDGNTCPWLRAPWIMLSNSVLIKQETSNMEWFYSALKPYIHYVPVKKDLTDIFQQLEWLKIHDAEAQQISLNAQNFIRNNLMPEHIDAHMAIILNEYSKIQQDSKIIPTLMDVEQDLTLPVLLKLLFKRLTARIINLWS